MVTTFVLQLGGPGPLFGDVDRTNFMYLSTLTRSSGLLLGAAAAFVWRPWRRARRHRRRPGPGARHRRRRRRSACSRCTAIAATLTAGYVYQWLLPLVSVLALVGRARRRAPGVAGGPARPRSGRRSSPSASAATACTCGTGRSSCSSARRTARSVAFVVAAALTVVVSELSYRYVETPVRRGALGRWWRTAGTGPQPRRC